MNEYIDGMWYAKGFKKAKEIHASRVADLRKKYVSLLEEAKRLHGDSFYISALETIIEEIDLVFREDEEP